MVCALFVVLAGIFVPAGPSGGATAPTCGTFTPLRADGTKWVCTFDDEFNGTSINRNLWKVQTTAAGGFRSGAACVLDDPRNVSVADGKLRLTVRATPAPFACKTPNGSFSTSWVGGSVYTRYFGQAYGRFAIRAKFPDANGRRGLQSALWTYPRDMTVHKALTGTTELDIAEAYSRWPDLVSATVHGFLGGTTQSCSIPDYGAAYHTFVMEWTVQRAVFYYDGVKCLSAGRTGTSQLFLVALTQGLGIKTDINDANTPFPSSMLVDWVRVWK